MANVTNFQVASSLVARPSLAKLGKVALLLPWMKTITDTPGTANSFNVVNDAGIPVPNAAPVLSLGAATGPTGLYSGYVTFYDINTDTEGNPSAKSNSLVVTNDKITWDLTGITNENTNTRVTHIRGYRNTDGSGIHRLVFEVTKATTSVTDDLLDTDIINADTLSESNSAPVASTYGYARSFRGFMFLYGPYNHRGGTTYDSRWTYAKVGSADQFPYWNESDIEPGLYGPLTNTAALGDSLAFFKKRAIYILRFDQEPHGLYGDGFGKTVSTLRGAISDRSIAETDSGVFVMDQKGIYVYPGGRATVSLSKPLKKFWKRINWAAQDLFSATWNEDTIWFFVALDQDTVPHHAFVYDLAAQKAGRGSRWWVYYFNQGIIDAGHHDVGNTDEATFYDMMYQDWPAFMDDKGYMFLLGTGYRDGLAPFLGHTVNTSGFFEVRVPRGTISSSSATSIVDDDALFEVSTNYETTVDARGLYVQFPDEPEIFPDAYPVLSINGGKDGLIFDTGVLPATPTVGTHYILGAIPKLEYQTPVSSLGEPEDRKIVEGLSVEFQPRALNFKLATEFVKDNRAPEDSAYDVDESGHEATEGVAGSMIDMGGSLKNEGGDGFKLQPIMGRGCRYIQAVLKGQYGVGIDSPAVIDSLRFKVKEAGSGV